MSTSLAMLKRILVILVLVSSHAFAQIAFNSSPNQASCGSGTSCTISYTVGSGTNRLLLATAGVNYTNPADEISGCTYNGIAMNKIVGVVVAERWVDGFWLLNPASGSHNLVCSFTFSEPFSAIEAADYTGVAQSGQPDNSTTNSGVSTALTTSLTTVADNCWTFFFGAKDYDGNTWLAGSGSTLRGYENTYSSFALFDSNGPVHPAGSKSMTITETPSSSITFGGVMASFKPAVASTFISGPLIGVGVP